MTTGYRSCFYLWISAFSIFLFLLSFPGASLQSSLRRNLSSASYLCSWWLQHYTMHSKQNRSAWRNVKFIWNPRFTGTYGDLCNKLKMLIRSSFIPITQIVYVLYRLLKGHWCFIVLSLLKIFHLTLEYYIKPIETIQKYGFNEKHLTVCMLFCEAQLYFCTQSSQSDVFMKREQLKCWEKETTYMRQKS